MPRIRYQLSTQRELDRQAHCLCLHVRPATVFLAVMNLVGASICTMFTLFFIVNNDTTFTRDEMNFVKRSNANFVSLLMYILLAFVSSMLLYAVMKSKPKYILPFFGIQFIDYLFSFPHLIATMTHADNYLAKTNKNFLEFQDKEEFDDINNVWTYSNYSHVYTTTLLLFSFVILLKTYFLCVVWKCYRYLHLKEILATFAPTQAIPGVVVNLSNVPPPNYEEATKLPECLPPEYTTVVTGLNENQIPVVTVVDTTEQTKKQEMN